MANEKLQSSIVTSRVKSHYEKFYIRLFESQQLNARKSFKSPMLIIHSFKLRPVYCCDLFKSTKTYMLVCSINCLRNVTIGLCCMYKIKRFVIVNIVNIIIAGLKPGLLPYNLI